MDFDLDLESLQEHLKQDVAHSLVSQTQKFVLDFGQPYIGVKRPQPFRLGRKKQCFANAVEAVVASSASRFPRISYVEGYALIPGLIPIHHAWISIDDQHAIELTVKNDPREMTFFGVPFSHSELGDLLTEVEVYGFLHPPISAAVTDLARHRKLGNPTD